MININFAPFPVLKTDRLVLRKLINEDKNEIFAIRSDPEIAKYLGRSLCKSVDEAAEFIIKINNSIASNESIYWAVTLKGNTKLSGTICLWNLSEKYSSAEIGFELLSAYQGKGIMIEAASAVINYGFQEMNPDIIEGEVDPANKSSIKLMEKLNFTRRMDIRNDDSEEIKNGTTIIYGIKNLRSSLK